MKELFHKRADAQHLWVDEKPGDHLPSAVRQADLRLSLAEAVLGCRKAVQGVAVTVPPGTLDGTRLTIENLVLWISVEPLEGAGLEQGALVQTLCLNVAQAGLGGSFPLRLVNGAVVQVTVPEGAAHGLMLDVPARDIPLPVKARVQLRVPTSLNHRQKKLLRQLDREGRHAA